MFHFRSGFVVRVDDHLKMRLAMEKFMKNAVEAEGVFEISHIELWRGLITIFFPGPTSFALTGVYKKLRKPLPPFLEKRVSVAMGMYIKNMN